MKFRIYKETYKDGSETFFIKSKTGLFWEKDVAHFVCGSETNYFSSLDSAIERVKGLYKAHQSITKTSVEIVFEDLGENL